MATRTETETARLAKLVEEQRARVERIECEQGHLGPDDLEAEWEILAELMRELSALTGEEIDWDA